MLPASSAISSEQTGQSKTALSIAEKLKAKGASGGGRGQTANVVSQQLEEVAKKQANSMHKPQWERFDMNRMSYEEEVPPQMP